MKSPILLGLISIVIWLAACTTVPTGQDVTTSWSKGLAFSPDEAEPRPLGEIQTSKRYPVLVLMHGCTGIESGSEIAWAKFIRDLGFFVVVPDSMARQDRGPSCDPRTAQHFGGYTVHGMRQQEINYAVAKVREAPWFDQRNLFLMGHSEGGVAAARTTRGDFNGIVISGWTCTSNRYPIFAGIHSPSSVPVLSLLWTWDRWFPAGDTSGTCEASLQGRAGSKHVSLEGTNHNTFPSPIARDEVHRFLRVNLK